MSLFPLYDRIVKSMDGRETVLTKNNCTTITRMSQEHLNIIYLIILHYYILNNPKKKDLPYGCKTVSNGKGICFKHLSMIPDECQKIIYRYIHH